MFFLLVLNVVIMDHSLIPSFPAKHITLENHHAINGQINYKSPFSMGKSTIFNE